MKILFISRWFPYPPDNGSKIRVFNLIKQLAPWHQVDLISFASEKIQPEHLDFMLRFCRQIETIPYCPFRPGSWKAISGLFSHQPRSVVDTYSPDVKHCVVESYRRENYDLIIVSQLEMAAYAVNLQGVVKIYEEIELTTFHEQFVRQTSLLKKFRGGLTWWKLVHYTRRLLNAFDGCTVVSQEERGRVLQIAPGYQTVEVIPNGVDVARYATDFGPPEADTLIYSGALTYSANFDAVNYFLYEIWPLIQAKRPGVKLLITGKLDGVPLERLPITPNNGVVLTGYLDDIRPTLARSWVNVVPLRLGGGTRLKILESLAIGTPVVSTCKGAEGLQLEPGRDLLIADTPADFAAAVLSLLQNPDLRETLSSNGRQTVTARYDWHIIGQQFNHFVEQVAAGKSVSTLS